MAIPLPADKTPALSPRELVRELLEGVADWADLGAVAHAAAGLLRRELARPSVAVHRYEADAESTVLLALAPEAPGAPAVGTRQVVRDALLAAAVREGRTQRALNAYVAPDFVRSLPGETRSRLAVPIRTGRGVHGVICLEYPSPHRPTEADEELAETFAAQLAAVAAATAQGATSAAAPGAQRRLQLAGVLSSISGRLQHSTDLPGTLRQVLDGALSLLPCEGAVLLLRDGSRQVLEVAALAGDLPFAPRDLFPLEGSLPGTVVRTGQPQMLRELRAASEPFHPQRPELELRDALLVPVAAGGVTLGVLGVLNRTDGEGHTPEDVDLLQGLAGQIGAVETMRQAARLRQRLSDGSLIAEVGRAVTGTLGLNEVLEMVVQSAQMLLSGHSAAVAVLDEERQEVTLVAATGMLRRSQGEALPLLESAIGQVILSGETVVTASFKDDPRCCALESALGAGVIVPLESRGRVSGALLAARRADEPSDEDLDALRKLVSYAAIAIDNARLYQQQTELSRTLRAQTAELEHAYADLRESQERLLVSEKMAALGRVTAGIAHEINSPLGSILNCLQLAQTYGEEYRSSIGDAQVTAEDHQAIAKDLLESLALAEGATRKVAQFVRSIKGQTRMGEAEVRAFDPAEQVTGTLVLLQHELRNKNVTVHSELAPELSLTGDASKFSVVVQNLVSNAMDAYCGAAGEVWVRLARGGGSVVLEVEDRGCGIPEEIRGRIFDYLFTTKDVGAGTGLGLSMVHSIVASNFDGKIDLRTEVGAGTTFIVTFPASAATD